MLIKLKPLKWSWIISRWKKLLLRIRSFHIHSIELPHRSVQTDSMNRCISFAPYGAFHSHRVEHSIYTGRSDLAKVFANNYKMPCFRNMSKDEPAATTTWSNLQVRYCVSLNITTFTYFITPIIADITYICIRHTTSLTFTSQYLKLQWWKLM